MSETVAGQCARLLREAAEAYDNLPPGLRTMSMLGGPVITTNNLRLEADRIEGRVRAYEEGSRPAGV